MSRTVIEELVTIFDFDVDDSQLRRANQAMDRWNRQATQGARNADMWGSRLQGAVLAYVGFDAAMRAGAGMINVIETNERYLAQLETMMGSQQAAAAEFERLDQFASTTPYSLDQSVQAFIKLKALGLDPSEEAMRSYGDTASAMGMDLIQFIEAVADASVGEFERLKEFGIKASSEGDRVRFTFRGATTEVGKNSEEIQAYLQSIGQGDFAGSMERMMDTVGGRLSNLRQAWRGLVWDMSKGELSEGLSRVLDALTGIVEKSEEVAEVFGGSMGTALNVAGLLLKMIERHARGAAIAVSFLGSTYVVSRLMRMISTIRLAGNAALVAQAKMLAIPAAIVAIIAIVALFVSELDNWKEGQFTLIDLLVEKWPELEGPLMRLKGLVEAFLHPGSDIPLLRTLDEIQAKFDALTDGLATTIAFLVDVFTLSRDSYRFDAVRGGRQIGGRMFRADADGNAVVTPEEMERYAGWRRSSIEDLDARRARLAQSAMGALPGGLLRTFGAPTPVVGDVHVTVTAREGESSDETGRRIGAAVAEETRRMAGRTARRHR